MSRRWRVRQIRLLNIVAAILLKSSLRENQMNRYPQLKRWPSAKSLINFITTGPSQFSGSVDGAKSTRKVNSSKKDRSNYLAWLSGKIGKILLLSVIIQ